jgi:hypothetical protein
MSRSKLGLVFVGLSVLQLSCASQQQTPKSVPAPPARWTVEVCSSVKGSVALQAGPSKDDSNLFATWRQGDGQKTYDLPARLQNLSEIYLKATSQDDGDTALCVRYDGHGKQAYNFNGKSQDHELKASDGDDSSCRCR